MKAFITKHCLTVGIQEVDDAELSSSSMISVLSLGVFANFHGEGREWHRAKDLAIIRANEMRAAKIKSLKKSISKLEAMKF